MLVKWDWLILFILMLFASTLLAAPADVSATDSQIVNNDEKAIYTVEFVLDGSFSLYAVIVVKELHGNDVQRMAGDKNRCI